MNPNDERIEIILPGSLRGDDERDAIEIFAQALEFAGTPVATSRQRTLLESTEPPLWFVIQLLTSPLAVNIEAGLITAMLLDGRKRMAKAVPKVYRSILARFPKRGVDITLRLPRGDAPTPNYPLSPNESELEKQIDGIVDDLRSGKKLHHGRRLWHDDAWMSAEEYFAFRRAEQESEGEQ
jgi:hypothetical protein